MVLVKQTNKQTNKLINKQKHYRWRENKVNKRKNERTLACLYGVSGPGFESCIQQSKTTCLLSIRKSLASLEVVSSIPAWSTIIYRFLCGFICVSLCQSIKIKPTNMYIASARAQFKINTHRCWNWHHVHSRQVVSCPVQPRARHWSCVILAWFQWREAYVLDNWQLAAGGVASVWRSWVRSPPGPR